jgi:hypothetical protein
VLYCMYPERLLSSSIGRASKIWCGAGGVATSNGLVSILSSHFRRSRVRGAN